MIVNFHNGNNVLLELDMNGIKKEIMPKDFQSFDINSEVKTLVFKAKFSYYKNDSLPYLVSLIYREVKIEDLKKEKRLSVKEMIKENAENISRVDYIKLIHLPYNIYVYSDYITIYP